MRFNAKMYNVEAAEIAKLILKKFEWARIEVGSDGLGRTFIISVRQPGETSIHLDECEFFP